MRKAPEPLDDLYVETPVTAQSPAAIPISREGVEKCHRAALVGEVFAVMKRHIEEQPPGRWDQLVEPAFKRPVRRRARRRIGYISVRRPAKDVAGHLVQQQHERERALG